MKKMILLMGGLGALVVLGAGCTTSVPQVNIKSSETTASSSSDAALKSSHATEENRYYAGTIGTKKIRLIYWPSGEGRNDRNFFEGVYVYEKESEALLPLKISFTSGGHFSATQYILAQEDQSTGITLENTDDCDGKTEEGVLCGEWRDAKNKKVLPFTFTLTEKFIIEDYLKHN